MVDIQEVDEQLKRLGYNFRYWGRNEIKELRRVLTDGEEIKHCVNGHYQGGFAMLVSTSHRLLLIDRKPMYLTIEAIWYDKIGQIDFNHRLLNASICISTPNKQLDFTTWNNNNLHELLIYVQEKMAEAKQGAGISSEQLTDAMELIENQALELAAQPAVSPVQTQEPQPVQDLQPHMYFPKIPVAPTTYDQTLYKATRLPFSRRRYFARQGV